MPTSIFDFTQKGFDPIGGSSDPLCGPGVFGQTLQPGFAPEYRSHPKGHPHGLEVKIRRIPGTIGTISAGFHAPIKLAEFVDLPKIEIELEFDKVDGKGLNGILPSTYAWAVVVLVKAGNQFWRYRSTGADSDSAHVATCQFRATSTVANSTRVNLPATYNASINPGTQANVPFDIFAGDGLQTTFKLKAILDNTVAGSTQIPVSAQCDWSKPGTSFNQVMSAFSNKFFHGDMDKISFVGANLAMANGDGEFSARFKKLTIST